MLLCYSNLATESQVRHQTAQRKSHRREGDEEVKESQPKALLPLIFGIQMWKFVQQK